MPTLFIEEIKERNTKPPRDDRRGSKPQPNKTTKQIKLNRQNHVLILQTRKSKATTNTKQRNTKKPAAAPLKNLTMRE